MATNPEGLKRWLEIHHNSRQQGASAQRSARGRPFDQLGATGGVQPSCFGIYQRLLNGSKSYQITRL
jgi:hypothetical protein